MIILFYSRIGKFQNQNTTNYIDPVDSGIILASLMAAVLCNDIYIYMGYVIY